jgi:hypothetical protein
MPQIKCKHCGTKSEREVNADGTLPKFCDKLCKKRAKNKRWLRNRSAPYDKKKCLVPGAGVFADNPKNRKYMAKKAPEYKRTWTDTCPCGGLHWEGNDVNSGTTTTAGAGVPAES